ncbi:MAG: hypothetical protein Q8M29_05545 [Bacteroidota bacterium]|nr:hypothetical protein [Bacteroidota bacterium]
MKIYYLLGFLSLFSTALYSQAGMDSIPGSIPKGLNSGRKNISKTNLLFGPFFKTVQVIQERKLSKRITTQTIAKTRIPSSFNASRFVKIDANGSSYNPFGSTKLSGIGNITEFRLYGKKKGAFKGFYGGVFFSYMHYKLQSASVRGSFQDDNGVTYEADVSQSIKVNITGGGLHCGVQGLIKDRFCIDWTILGVGVAGLGIKGSIDATNTSDNFDFRNYKDDVDDMTFGMEKILPIKKTVERESVSLGVKAPWVLFRMGLSVGFAY